MATNDLLQSLHQSLAETASDALVVALSGGRDSMALLHCAARYAQQNQLALRAIHVNHHLQEAADRFERCCRDFCALLTITLDVVHVSVDVESGDSVEAAARAARYNAFEQNLRPNETLLVAHHRGDQAETFLLQALRGAGPVGLAAMPVHQTLGRGHLRRPWLNLTRNDIDHYVREHAIPFAEDPSNSDPRFKRNALRLDVLPHLAEHFAAYDKTLARAAQHCAESATLLDDLARIDAAHCIDPMRNSLRVSVWRSIDDARRRNLLRWWFAQQHVRMPSEAKLRNLCQMLLRSDSYDLAMELDEHALHVYRDHVFVIPTLADSTQWIYRDGVWLATQLASSFSIVNGDIAAISVGELPLKLATPHCDRKTFLQQLGVPSWLRAHIPAIYYYGELWCYGSLWTNPSFHLDIKLDFQGRLPLLWQRCSGIAAHPVASN